MTHKVNVGGNQGRGDPEAGRDAPHSTWIADLDYDEPETQDLELDPLPQWVRVALACGVGLAAVGVVSLIVSCVSN